MDQYFEIFRGAVNSWECDTMGHMNVQFYTGKIAEGMPHFRSACGISPSYMSQTGHSMVLIKSLARYQNELRAGDSLHIQAALLKASNKTIEAVVDIINTETGALSCSVDFTCMCFNLNERRSMPWPEEIRLRIEKLVTKRRDLPRPAATGNPQAPHTGKYSTPFISCRGSVNSWECDELGHMSARYYMTRAADAVGHVKNNYGLTNQAPAMQRSGSAALEYTIEYHRELKAGESYTMYSGLLEFKNKTFRFGHTLINDDQKQICATFDAIACLFDLEKRKAIEIPEFIRKNAETDIVEWPMRLSSLF